MKRTQPDGYLALPKTGRGAGVLVLPAWWGLNDFFKDFCKRLAREGFVAFAADLYHGQVASTIEEAEQLRSQLVRKQARADIVAAAEYLRGLEVVSSQALGTVGFSLGANFALGLSIEKPDLVRAVVTFYGTSGGDYTRAKAAYLGHFAEIDEWEATSGVKRLEKSLRAAGRPVTFYTYAETGHWFFEKDRVDAYDAPAAKLAWQRSVSFLRTTLVS